MNGECFLAGLVSLLWRCCPKLEFKSADSRVLQFIDTNRTLKWLPTKLSNSMRFFNFLVKDNFVIFIIDKHVSP